MKQIISKSIVLLTDSFSLKAKIIAIFFAFIVIPLGVFTMIAYYRTNSLVLTQTLSTATQSFEESTSILQRHFTNMNTAMQNMLFDTDIYNVASMDTINYTPIQQLEAYNLMIKRFYYLRNSTGIDNIRFYIDTNANYSENNINIFSLNKIIDKTWYKNLLSIGQNRLWCQPSVLVDETSTSQDFFSFTSIIYSMLNLKQPLAVLSVDIQSEKIENALRNATITDNSFVFISDGKKVLFPSPNEEQLSLINTLNASPFEFSSDHWSYRRINNRNYYIVAKLIDPTKWYVLSIIPQDDISQLNKKMRDQMVLVLILIASISYFLAFIISNSSLKRLLLLNLEMKKVEQGSLETSLKPVGKDEIGELMRSFNKMIFRMADMMDEAHKMSHAIKSAELRALQAQINPHFLYNSLDMINCSAILHNIPEITQMVTSLAKFYKLCLSNGKDMISIQDELMHVKLYVMIQNLRFSNKINLIFHVDTEIYVYSTLKTILQPIVENSIIHGIFEKEEKTGTITISAEKNGEVIELIVQDDGIGMPDEVVRQILIEDKSTHQHGYGAKNTNDRIKLYYGNEYGLTYNSEVGKGTSVKISFPTTIL